MRVKHIIWVVRAQFIDFAELNKLLVNAGGNKNCRMNELNRILSVDWLRFKSQLSCIPWVSEFFLFLDVAVCVKAFVHLSLIQLVDLIL